MTTRLATTSVATQPATHSSGTAVCGAALTDVVVTVDVRFDVTTLGGRVLVTTEVWVVVFVEISVTVEVALGRT